MPQLIRSASLSLVDLGLDSEVLRSIWVIHTPSLELAQFNE
jgi:hypothetical protein